MPKLQMLAKFKKLEAGKVVTVEDEVLAKWLIDRKYALPFTPAPAAAGKKDEKK
jgi:hypothetical protein